jgi:nicotinate-nucleotide adenylyltransferase
MIGIFGGTFDPIHFGHLRPALEVYQDLHFNELRWIPSGQPPHRDSPNVSIEHRLNMLRLALQGVHQSVIDECEIQRPGPSYMFDTLTSLRQQFPQTGLALILGMDAFNGLSAWYRWQELLQLAHIVVCSRPGVDMPVTGELHALIDASRVDDISRLHNSSSGLIYIHPVTALPISATKIRDMCQQGKSPRFLLPANVCDYIEQNDLYR